ncbi:hypothetical protein [Geodermatophilus poikilotrophus]|uniref:Heme peroxidase n=1 Tax=Geodermatophilus poikilotrophus TaxID=1333667 RepID=A0A1I0DLX0_9ACTN|nr:hypothetical protein [Geodermatophilus poikilotrophus]SET33303.1 hypothetical protein SAMN04488546_2006 [Geodermatophilus poikilotrophus]
MKADDAVAALVARCRPLLGDLRQLATPPTYPDSLALCVIEAVQSPGISHSVVEAVVGRYRAYRATSGGNADTDGAVELLASFRDLGTEGWMKQIGTRNRTPPRPGAPFKAEVIERAASVLVELGAASTAEVRVAAEDPAKLAELHAGWSAVVGRGTGATWHYLLILAGVPGVKPDRLIARFVSDATGVPSRLLETAAAGRLLELAATELGVSSAILDFHVWDWQRRLR